MAKRQQIGYLPPQLRKLQRSQNLTTNEVIKELKKAQRTIAKEVAYLTAKADVMASARQRERIYKMIAEHYQVLAVNLDEHITALVEQAAKGAHDLAAKEIRTSGAKSVMKYSPERTNRYLAMVNDETSGSMAAVFTDQMANREIRALRTAWVDTYRQAALTGMTANDTQRVLQNKWDKLTDNTDAFRFVDKSGKSWSNARYLQMLIRTNSQRISRDSYVDTLVESGFKLARISGGGGSTTCPICSAWAGRIVQVAGESRKWPTYEDAISAGMFHPNCIHYLEYMDETWDKKEIDLQGSIPKPPDGSTTEFIQHQKDQIDEGRYTQKGLSQIEAQRAVTRDRLKSNILTGTFNADAQRAVESLTGEQLDEIRKQGVPAFLMVKKGDNPGWHKGSRGGIVHIPREAGPDDVLKAMGLDNKAAAVSDSSGNELLKNAVEQAAKAGYSEPLLDAIRKTPPAVLNKTTLPEMVPDKKAFYRSDDGKIRMPVNANTWSGHPSVFHHELGHHIERTSRATTMKLGANGKKWIKEPEQEFQTAMQADEKTWQNRAGELFGENWKKDMRFANTYDGVIRRYKMNDVVAKASGLAETYQDLNDEGQHRIRALLDTFHGISKGKYGDGHESGYQKRFGSGEVFANCYQASVMGWSEFELAFPEVMKYVKGKLGAKT